LKLTLPFLGTAQDFVIWCISDRLDAYGSTVTTRILIA